MLFGANQTTDVVQLLENTLQIAGIQKVENPPLTVFGVNIFAAVLIFLLPVHDASGTLDDPLFN
ncbi:hypothetical protein D3C72_2493660 [compost metagenome]